MDNKIENGKYFYDIEKITFFNNLKNIHTHSNRVLEQFKHDFNMFTFTINQKKITHSNELLEFLLQKYEKYLEEILLLSSQYAIKEIIKTLTHILWSSYYISENKIQNKKPQIDIQLHLFMKQVIITFYIDILECTKKSSHVTHKQARVQLIFNITNFKYVRITVETI